MLIYVLIFQHQIFILSTHCQFCVYVCLNISENIRKIFHNANIQVLCITHIHTHICKYIQIYYIIYDCMYVHMCLANCAGVVETQCD